MNLAIALVSREAGGAEFQACLLADALRSRGHAVTFYCTSPATTDAMLEQFPEMPVRIARWPTWLGFRGRLGYLAVVAQFRRWIHRDRLDAAVGFLAMPHTILSAACLGTTVRLVGRRSCVWSEIQGIGNYDQQLARLVSWQKRWGWRTAAIIANSPAAARDAFQIEGWPSWMVSVVPNGWPEFPPSTCEGNVPYYCARPREEKAVDVATQEFAKAGVPLALSFDPPDWTQVGILAHCSKADSMSNSVGMAAAHGIPVVAFNLPGNADLIGEKNCIPPGDYREMAEQVGLLHRNRLLRYRVGRDLWSSMRKRFSLKTMVDQWEHILSTQ